MERRRGRASVHKHHQDVTGFSVKSLVTVSGAEGCFFGKALTPQGLLISGFTSVPRVTIALLLTIVGWKQRGSSIRKQAGRGYWVLAAVVDVIVVVMVVLLLLCMYSVLVIPCSLWRWQSNDNGGNGVAVDNTTDDQIDFILVWMLL